jgi:LPXTG-motif cell wall-anchored protein
VARIAAADGHPIPAPTRLSGTATGAGSPTWPIAVGLAVVAVLAAGGLLTLRRRGAGRRRAVPPRRAVRPRR